MKIGQSSGGAKPFSGGAKCPPSIPLKKTLELNVGYYKRWTSFTSEHERAQDMEAAAKDLQDIQKTVPTTSYNIQHAQQKTTAKLVVSSRYVHSPQTCCFCRYE